MSSVRYFPAVLAFLALFSGSASAATIQATSCQRDRVIAAISSARDGDTVVIPGGSCTWVGTVTIDKSITLRGAGIDVTIITDGNAAGSNSKPHLLRWQTKSTGGSPAGFARLTGFTFHGGNTGGMDPANDAHIVFTGDTANLRIDNNKFVPTRGVGLKIQGFIRGVLDHNTFQLDSRNFRQGLVIHHPHWNNVGGYGDNSWAQPNNFGSGDFLFVENTTFTNDRGQVYANDGWMGQRVVFRKNTYINATWANHGTETGGRPRSARSAEIYQNTFIGNTSSFVFPSFAGSRGGTHMIFDNAVTTSNGAYVTNFFDLTYYRQYDTRTFYVWGACDGSNPWDGNSGPGSVARGSERGYRCVDQPGAGRGAMVSGDNPTPFRLNQALEPIYVWNNRKNGVLDRSSINHQATVVKRDRDVYDQTSSFDGTSGVGRGPLSSRPSTCTTGVAYWATDQGEWDSTNPGPDGRLYRCMSTNSWAVFYTPYTYPHPLVSGTPAPDTTSAPPAPPTNVRIVGAN